MNITIDDMTKYCKSKDWNYVIHGGEFLQLKEQGLAIGNIAIKTITQLEYCFRYPFVLQQKVEPVRHLYVCNLLNAMYPKSKAIYNINDGSIFIDFISVVTTEDVALFFDEVANESLEVLDELAGKYVDLLTDDEGFSEFIKNYLTVKTDQKEERKPSIAL